MAKKSVTTENEVEPQADTAVGFQFITSQPTGPYVGFRIVNVELPKEATKLSNVGLGPPLITPPDLQTTFVFPDWSYLLSDGDYAGEGDSRVVKVQALRRLGDLRGVISRTVLDVECFDGNYVVKVELAVREPDGTTTYWSNVGEANAALLLEPYNEHPASNAATRAESRALRMLLNISTVSDAEVQHSKGGIGKREDERVATRQIQDVAHLRGITDEVILTMLRNITGQPLKSIPEEIGVSQSSALIKAINAYQPPKGKGK